MRAGLALDIIRAGDGKPAESPLSGCEAPAPLVLITLARQSKNRASRTGLTRQAEMPVSRIRVVLSRWPTVVSTTSRAEAIAASDLIDCTSAKPSISGKSRSRMTTAKGLPAAASRRRIDSASSPLSTLASATPTLSRC